MKFKQTRASSGSNYDSLKVAESVVIHGLQRFPLSPSTFWRNGCQGSGLGKILLSLTVVDDPLTQMPRHQIGGAHGWINEIPFAPIYYLAKPQPRERAWDNQWRKKTLLSLTPVLCEMTEEVLDRWSLWRR